MNEWDPQNVIVIGSNDGIVKVSFLLTSYPFYTAYSRYWKSQLLSNGRYSLSHIFLGIKSHELRM